MKLIKTLISLLFITLLSSPSWSETLTMNDLVENPSNGLFYKIFTQIPFTGSVSNIPLALPEEIYSMDEFYRGSFVDGKKNGLWETYLGTGRLSLIDTYKDGIRHGVSKVYSINGHLGFSGYFTNGKKNGVFEIYFENGKLKQKVNFTNDKKDGTEFYYLEDGTLEKTETYKDGELVE